MRSDGAANSLSLNNGWYRSVSGALAQPASIAATSRTLQFLIRRLLARECDLEGAKENRLGWKYRSIAAEVAITSRAAGLGGRLSSLLLGEQQRLDHVPGRAAVAHQLPQRDRGFHAEIDLDALVAAGFFLGLRPLLLGAALPLRSGGPRRFERNLHGSSSCARFQCSCLRGRRPADLRAGGTKGIEGRTAGAPIIERWSTAHRDGGVPLWNGSF